MWLWFVRGLFHCFVTDRKSGEDGGFPLIRPPATFSPNGEKAGLRGPGGKNRYFWQKRGVFAENVAKPAVPGGKVTGAFGK